MIKNLIYKELKLTIPVAAFLFSLLSVLLLIPNYPYCVGILYFVVALQIIFQLARANKDLEFTASLPVSRRAIVMSRHISAMLIQALQIILAVPFALISSLIISPQGNSVGMDANFAFFGITLIEYSVFNVILFPEFFKSGYKLAKPLILAIAGFVLTVAALEFLVAFVPVLKVNLDSLNPDTFIYQILLLIAGILIYFGANCLSCKLSARNFDKVSI